MPRTVLLALLAALCAAGARGAELPAPPEFTHTQSAEWLNSAPLRLSELRGRVVLVEFWAFACQNCRATKPWVESIAARDAERGLVVVAVHTPELAVERAPAQVRAAVARLGIRYPVMLDADSSYWNALHNQYWPAFYIIGRDGRIHGRAIGELHAGDDGARQVEALIDTLLAAPAR